MPHICTRCNNVFHKGEDILKGCPVCGWKKFLFTRKEPGEREASTQVPTITKAMGVRVPPLPKMPPVSEREGKIAQENIDKVDIALKISPREEKKQLPLSREPDSETRGDAKVESIRITAPGTYELNLPSLFEREELIMAVKEGTYLIDLTSAFRKGKKE
jgi:predicted  nucleic acid-binding Zn-ribbon protein